MSSRSVRTWTGAACLAALAACSSAPAPTSLSGPGGINPDGSSTTSAGGTAGTGAVTGRTGSAPGSAGAGVTGSGGGAAGNGAAGSGTGGSVAAGGGTIAGGAGRATGSGGAGSGPAAGAGTGNARGGSRGGGTVPNPGVTGPSGPMRTRSQLFSGAEETVGLTPTSLRLCAHAALTYGKAFNTTDADFNVFWQAVNAEKGGIYGRKVEVTYENDNYSPETAVQAATACKAKGIFMLLGGIGFDQIPTVRNWAETNRMLYLHHTATIKGTAGQKYSFSELPTVERMGEGFAQLAISKYRDKKIGIIEREGANWRPGVEQFLRLAKKAGLNIVKEDRVPDKQGNYTSNILDMKNAGAEVVWLWENALNATELLKQAKAQQYSPHWLMFPFNLTSQTLGNDALTPAFDGVAMYPAYSKGDYTGGFASYADDVKLFEAQYAKYDSGVDLSGNGGDLLFLNWTAQKALYAQLLQCGKACTRDSFVDVLQGYDGKPTSSACTIDFLHSADGHHGAEDLNFMQTYMSPSGKVNWHNTQSCVGRP